MEEILAFFTLTVRDAQVIAVATVLFFLFVAAMGKYLFRPLIALMDAREAATSGATASADDLIREARELDRSVEERITQVRVDAMKKKLERVAAARARADDIVRRAMDEGAKLVARERERALAEAHRMSSELQHTIPALSQAVAQSVTSPEQWRRGTRGGIIQ